MAVASDRTFELSLDDPMTLTVLCTGFNNDPAR
jgi:hypothetical protein